MPIYEYTCEGCETRSEIFIKGSEVPVCPHCGSDQLHKEWSTFAAHGEKSVGTAAAHAHGPGCGCCMGPQGSCGLN
jgi:putative FmdB family regulatory protein